MRSRDSDAISLRRPLPRHADWSWKSKYSPWTPSHAEWCSTTPGKSSLTGNYCATYRSANWSGPSPRVSLRFWWWVVGGIPTNRVASRFIELRQAGAWQRLNRWTFPTLGPIKFIISPRLGADQLRLHLEDFKSLEMCLLNGLIHSFKTRVIVVGWFTFKQYLLFTLGPLLLCVSQVCNIDYWQESRKWIISVCHPKVQRCVLEWDIDLWLKRNRISSVDSTLLNITIVPFRWTSLSNRIWVVQGYCTSLAKLCLSSQSSVFTCQALTSLDCRGSLERFSASSWSFHLCGLTSLVAALGQIL